MAIYSVISKAPIEKYKLPANYCMNSWKIFEFTKPAYEFARKEKTSTKSNSAYVSLSLAKPLVSKDGLISMLPMASAMHRFHGQYLKIPFHQLSPKYVYRSSVHNCPVFDALTADPISKRLFLFQMTLLDPKEHPKSISAFNAVISHLHLDSIDTIKEICFYLIVSALKKIESQHYFSFSINSIELNACFLQEFSSGIGQAALKQVFNASQSADTLPLSTKEVRYIYICKLSKSRKDFIESFWIVFPQERIFARFHWSRRIATRERTYPYLITKIHRFTNIFYLFKMIYVCFIMLYLVL